MDPAWLAVGIAATSLSWNVVEAVRKRRTRVRVEIRHVAAPDYLSGEELISIPGIGFSDAPTVWPAHDDERLAYVVVVVAINQGETAESVGDMGVMDVGRSVGTGADDGSGPRELSPRDRVTWAFAADGVSFDVREGFFAQVVLGSGKRIESGPHFLDDGLVAIIDEHNAKADVQPES